MINIILSLNILGSNMPCTPEAIDVLRKANVLTAPSVAAGAGGVRPRSLNMPTLSLSLSLSLSHTHTHSEVL